ncbi:unnamed protein product [Ectocarpus sp. 13 AM-2016]
MMVWADTTVTGLYWHRMYMPLLKYCMCAYMVHVTIFHSTTRREVITAVNLCIFAFNKAAARYKAVILETTEFSPRSTDFPPPLPFRPGSMVSLF